MPGLSLANFAYPISNVIVPQGGPKTVPAVLDFTNVATIDIDGQAIIDAHAIEFIQGVFIDNADNAVPFTLIANTQQRIVCAANSQGFFPLLVQNPPKLTANMAQAAGRKVAVQFYNVPIMTSVWKTV
jgi:hypothetical protein